MSIPLPGRVLPPSPRVFRALRHRDFRLLWLGQIVSLTGTWMQSVAQGWLVFRLSNSAFQLGLVGFCSYLPFLVFGLLGGVAADRFARRKALLWTQGLAMVLAMVLAYLSWMGWIRVWQVALLAFGLGVTTAFDIPIRQSFLQELVGREDLQNAIALNSMAFNGARFVGPAVAGIVVAAWGEATCFFINAMSFVAVLAGLAMMDNAGLPGSAGHSSWLDEVREVLAYSRRSPRARAILVLVAVTSVFGAPYSILLPAIARDVLGVGAEQLGFLMGAAGGGAVLGALFLAARKSIRFVGRIVAVSMTLLGSGLIGFSLSRTFGLSAMLLVFVGAAMLVQLGSSNAYLQLAAPPALRGRIVSLYMLGFIGMAPLGSLLSGTVARWLGPAAAVGIGGAVCVATAAAFAVRIPRLRLAGAPDEIEDAGTA